MAKNEMVRQHHQLNRHEFEKIPDDEGQKDREAWRVVVYGVAKSLM